MGWIVQLHARLCFAAAGLDFVAGCHDLLTNTLVELNLDSEANAVVQAGEVCMLLQALQCLHTLGLNCFRGTQVDLASLPAVHTLSLKQCAINVDDLSSHTQLTSLEINWDQRLDQALLLTGSTVQLQRLQISANEVAFQVIRNLQAATQLTHLTLASIADPQLHFEGLTALRELSLEFCNMTVCDLSSCTRLTEVQIYWGDVISQEVNLPAGSTVQLQRLCILARHNQHYFSVLRKLEDATQLTYIHLRNTCPLDIGEHGWPEFMPSLQVFKANQIPFAPPKQLTEYTNLRQVHLGCHFKGPPADCLPKWSSQLSNLTKLETLSISGGFKQWPSFVMHLRQLRCLDLSCNQLSQRWIVFRHLAIYNLQCPHIP